MTNPRPAIQWSGDAGTGHLILIDQTLLPVEYRELRCSTVEAVWEAIKSLRVRGAPAIGVAAAYGVVIGAQAGDVSKAVEHLRSSRPTTVNLFWALDRMSEVINSRPSDLASALLREAERIDQEDRAMCRNIGRNGSGL